MRSIRKWIFSTIFAVLLLEILLRILGIYQTYGESIGQGYQSYFGTESGNLYNTYGANSTFMMDHGDFKYKYTTNELGLREKPMDEACDSHYYKVIVLGDSYTEGVGTSYDSAWPRSIEQRLYAKQPTIAVINAGVSGSDAFFEYALYKDKLVSCSGNVVIVSLNSTDIDDYFFRGGMERFKIKGKVVNKKGPASEWLYHYSYVARVISVLVLRQRQQLFVTDAEYEKSEQEFIQKTTEILKTLKSQLNSKQKLLVAVHPQPIECAYKTSKKNIHTGKIMGQLIGELRQNGIATIDLYPMLNAVINEDNLMEYTYEHDRHFNGKGYKLFADSLLVGINRMYPDTWD